VPSGRLHDLLPADPPAQANDLLLLQGELANDYSELCSVFRAYSRVDHTIDQPMTDSPIVAQGCLLMQFTDYTELLKDLKLQSRNIKQAALDEIYEQCTEGVSRPHTSHTRCSHAHRGLHPSRSVSRLTLFSCVSLCQDVVSSTALSPNQFIEAIVR
jgi:hypothetical protein